MIVFIRNIPRDLAQKELERFVSVGLRRIRIFPFFAKGILKSADVIRIKHRNQVEYHGLADIEGDRAANALIRLLQGTELGGHRIRLWPYRQRMENRDRRTQHPCAEELAIIDRRRGERRRSGLLIENLYGSQLPPAYPSQGLNTD